MPGEGPVSSPQPWPSSLLCRETGLVPAGAQASSALGGCILGLRSVCLCGKQVCGRC